MSDDSSPTRYHAHPSMVRMRPLGTLVAIMLIGVGLALAVAGPSLVPVGLSRVIGGANGQLIQVGGIVLLSLAALQLLAWWVATRADSLRITDTELVWTHGLLTKQFTEIGMDSVRTVRVSQSPFQRILDAGDVSVFTTGDLPELVVRGLPQPNRIRTLVKTRGGSQPER